MVTGFDLRSYLWEIPSYVGIAVRLYMPVTQEVSWSRKYCGAGIHERLVRIGENIQEVNDDRVLYQLI